MRHKMKKDEIFPQKSLTHLPFLSVFFVKQESSGVGGKDGGVDDKDQDEPIPNSLKRTVMKDCPTMDARRLQLVFRHDVGGT